MDIEEVQKNAKRLNSIRGTQRFTKPSQTNGGENIRIDSETAIPKLKNLVCPCGFAIHRGINAGL